MATKDPIALIEALDNPNVRAFLRMLRHGEGTAGDNGYRVQFGGGLFASFVDHPRQPTTQPAQAGFFMPGETHDA